MRVFVTGAAGFIGASVCKALIAGGHEVAGLVRSTTQLDRLASIEDKLKIIEGDLNNLPAWSSELSAWKPNGCIHLAWYAEPGKYLHSSENITALNNSILLLKLLIDLHCGHVVMAGTCAEYNAEQGYLHETDTIKPASLYAACKHSLNIVAQQMTVSTDTIFSWGRIFYLYGPYENQKRVVPALINRLLNGERFPATEGRQVRDFLHVDDAAEAFCKILTGGGGDYNVSSSRPITMRDIMGCVGDNLGCKDLIDYGVAPSNDWDPPFVCGNNDRLRKLGWNQQYDLNSGIQSAIEYWRFLR